MPAASPIASESEHGTPLDKQTIVQETNCLTPDQALLRAIGAIDFEGACAALASGANVNHTRPLSPTESPADQPTSPLRMIMFRLSDCLLTDAADDTLIRLAHLLLAWGADPEPAIEMAQARYGPPRDVKELGESGGCVTALDTVYSLVVAAAEAKDRTSREEQERIFREELAKDSGDGMTVSRTLYDGYRPAPGYHPETLYGRTLAFLLILAFFSSCKSSAGYYHVTWARISYLTLFAPLRAVVLVTLNVWSDCVVSLQLGARKSPAVRKCRMQ